MSAPALSMRLFIRAPAFLAGAILGLALATPVIAAVDIADKPLFTTPRVDPALIMTVDDSGSMDSEILTKNNDGALWWHTVDRSFTGRNQSDALEAGVLNFNINGSADNTWKKFVYLFPNGTGQTSGRRLYSDSTHDHYAVPPIGDFAFARSHEYNLMYFNPATTYEPWPNLGGHTFNNSTPTAAKTDPTNGSETFNLTADRINSADNHRFRVYPGMTLPIGTRKLSGSTCQAPLTAPEPVTAVASQALCYFPATFYLKETTPLPAGFGYLANKTIGGADAVIDGKAPDGSNMIRYEIKRENFVPKTDGNGNVIKDDDGNIISEPYDAAIQNFANWFTYYHKRHIATRGAIGQAFEDIYGFRIGSYLINTNPSSTLVYRNLSEPSDRNAFFEMIYEDYLGSGGTPNRLAVNRMWSQLTRTDAGAPIREKCQMNFGVLFTDGYSNVDNTGVGNRDGGMGAPFADTYSNTIADVAARLYLDNPRTDLPAGAVPVPLGCSIAPPPPDLDCNTNLHLNLFAITMGSPGTIFNVNQAQTDDPYTNPPTWPNVTAVRNPVQIDDLWHATLNSRGTLLSVDVPSELGEKFGAILAEIGSRLETSSSSAATSSAILSTSTLVYTAGFRSVDWSGTFTAHSVTAGEEQGPLVWNAEDKLLGLGASSRKIFTRAADTAGVGAGVEFLWDNLTAAQKAALNLDDLGSDRVKWLRGDENANAAFRDRNERLLGDIVNSDPQYEDGVLYVGANDGMLHAFDGATGDEIFAFIPSELLLPEPGESYAPLSLLTDPNYVHRYMMDGTVFVATAILSGMPKKILVGSTGLGGRSVFALDVTDVTNTPFSDSNVLWEFRDADLGYGVGQPLIGQFNDGTWVAVFGNGYNSDNHRAFLYVVNLATGALIAKLDTAVGDETTPNGLAAPIGTIWPAMSGKAQRIYAGDLLGNLWRFDVSSTPWTVELLFTATDDNGNPQPITSRPAVGKLPNVDDYVVVTFGTGSYFRTPDKTDNHIQSLYGIFDPIGAVPSPANDRDDLLEQEIVYYGIKTFGIHPHTYAHRVRVLSNHALDTTTPEAGWYIDLDQADTGELGERVISGAKVKYSGELVWAEISTLILDEDVCGSGRYGYLMDINLATGGRTASAVFDLDFDGTFDADDRVQLDEEDEDGEKIWAHVSGINYGQGEEIITIGSPNQPYELLVPGGDPQGRYKRGLKSGTDLGRQGWQQLR